MTGGVDTPPMHSHPIFHMSSSSVVPIIISIEGNIGSGKTTLIRKLKSHFQTREPCGVYFLEEPVDIWESITNDTKDKNILQLFYEDKPRYCLTFQNLALSTRCSAIKNILDQNNPKYKVIIMERSLYCDQHVFASMLRDCGDMSNMEFDIYMKYTKACASPDYYPKAVIWVNTPWQTCHQNIAFRNRPGEHDISTEYLTQLEQYHERWLTNIPGGGPMVVPVSIPRATTTSDVDINTAIESCMEPCMRIINEFTSSIALN